jgi:uncharacterized protein YkwD
MKILPLALALAMVACQPSEPAQAPPGSPPPGHWYGPPAPPQQRPPTIGEALGAVGVLILSIPSQLPQPTWAPWPWPLPQQPPPDTNSPASAWEDEVLRLTNARRVAGAICGGQSYRPVAPLAPDAALRAAARAHSRDMAVRGFFSHTNPDGRSPADRAVAAGYPSRHVGENIAAGHRSPAEVVDGWMQSAGHCQNIMEPSYRVLGVGHWYAANTAHANYWSQSFGG